MLRTSWLDNTRRDTWAANLYLLVFICKSSTTGSEAVGEWQQASPVKVQLHPLQTLQKLLFTTIAVQYRRPVFYVLKPFSANCLCWLKLWSVRQQCSCKNGNVLTAKLTVKTDKNTVNFWFIAIELLFSELLVVWTVFKTGQ